jgi:hypothetical protein
MTTPVLWGSRLHLNTTSAGSQMISSLQALNDGTFVAVWTDMSATGRDTDEGAIRGQLLNADGSRKGVEFQVNTTTKSHQSQPVVTALDDGRFVVAWTDESGLLDKHGTGIRARVYTRDGQPVGDDFQVNTAPDGDQMNPSIAALSNGRFVIAYENTYKGNPLDGSGSFIAAQTFDASLNRLGRETVVNQTTSNDQRNPTAIGLGDSYAVFFADDSGSGDDPDGTIRGRIVSSTGEAKSEFLVPSTAGNKGAPFATALTDGRFVVTWSVMGGEAH